MEYPIFEPLALAALGAIFVSLVGWWLFNSDAPRYCQHCGYLVIVESRPSWDSKTGESKEMWLWRCPRADVTIWPDGASRVVEYGDGRHDWGRGKPRWFKYEVLEDLDD